MKKLVGVFVLSVILTGCSALSDNLTLEGDIQNEIISASTTVAGKIVKMNKQQGEPVKKGDIIAVIDNTSQKYAVDQLQAVVNMKKAKLEELKAGTRPQQIEQARAQLRAAKAQLDQLTSGNRTEQINQARSQVAAAQEAANAAKVTYDYVTTQYNTALKLHKDGALSKNGLDDAKYKLDSAGKQLASARYQLESAKQQLALLENGSTTQSINTAKANYDSANAQLSLLLSGATTQTILAAQADLNQSVAQLNQAKYTLNNCNITALEDGIIISKNYDLGDVVNVGNNIADIATHKGLYVLCYIPDEYLDDIKYNQELKVATPTGEQAGRVSYIALKHEYTPKDKQSTSDSKHIATKIKVAINSDNGKLKSGMKAEVKVPLQK